MTSERYLVIHGHFYQPPRENPWIMAIEPQESAAPFTDWNARINRECYAPNCRARLLAPDGRIDRLINNYRYLSFNFGPTLLSWLSQADPDTYGRILEADRLAAAERRGHGPALAQVFNHIIMPLAGDRDRLTQIRWGLEDFRRRFGRRAEGMWLAETAADLKTLEMLAREGVKFTILAQGQARAVRPLAGGGRPGTREWEDVAGGRLDPREPYRVFWGPGPDDYLDVFFYDGPVSRAIAFEKLLSDGRGFLHRIEQAFGHPREDGRPRLVNLATDGESYGHHFPFGDMALAWLFDHLQGQSGQPGAIRLTNYGEYLEMFPPVREAAIIDGTSWSCAHGVERWRSDCGCRTGGEGDQKWRAPLRQGLDWLRDQLAVIFETEGARFFSDPWAARDDYVRIIEADYDEEVRDEFLRRHAGRPLDPPERVKALALLECQLMSLYMFTSCGWFFDDICGLEPLQNLRYARRALELARTWAGADLEEGLVGYLRTIKPNDPDYGDGREVWEQLVVPDRLDSTRLAAHWAAAVILDLPEVLNFFRTPVFESRTVTRLKGEGLEILAGAVDLNHRPLGVTDRRYCLAVYSGGAHLAILVGRPSQVAQPASADPVWLEEGYLLEALGEHLRASAALNVWDVMVKLMPRTSRYVLWDLRPHIRAELLDTLVRDIYEGLKERAREAFHLNQHLLMMSRAAGRPASWVERFLFRVVGESELRRLLEPARFGQSLNLVALGNLVNKRGLVGLLKDESLLGELGGPLLDHFFQVLAEGGEPRRALRELTGFIQLAGERGHHLDLWPSQNKWYDLYRDPDFAGRLTPEERELMGRLGQVLGFRPEPDA